MVIHHGSSILHLRSGVIFKKRELPNCGSTWGFSGISYQTKSGGDYRKYVQLNVESYGGVNLSSWLDRGLSAAGRVVLKSEDVFRPKVSLVDLEKTLFTIPNIAIHLEREMNKGVELNKQTQMLPIVGILEEEVDKTAFECACGKASSAGG